MALLVPRGLLSPNITAWPESHAFSFTQPVIKQSKGREGRGKLSDRMGIVEEAHNVKVLGSGNRFIVLAHGFGTDQSVWKHFVPYLIDDFRVVLYDNMGAGTTNPDYFDSERHSSLEGYAYDLLAILEELQIDSCIFVGHSVSAMIGAIASISRPDLFSKLIMVSASPR